MAILSIRVFGDPGLRTPAETITTFDEALARVAADMTDTMKAAPGVGLAAPQVGVSRRLFTYDDGEEHAGALCNPEIVWSSDETQTGEEGCLSIPQIYFPVTRSMKVKVKAQTLGGEPVDLEGEGLLARIFQHEIDHLNGVLFVDRLDDETRGEAMRAIREATLGFATTEPQPPKANAL
jgi:peptide deformylase